MHSLHQCSKLFGSTSRLYTQEYLNQKGVSVMKSGSFLFACLITAFICFLSDYAFAEKWVEVLHDRNNGFAHLVDVDSIKMGKESFTIYTKQYSWGRTMKGANPPLGYVVMNTKIDCSKNEFTVLSSSFYSDTGDLIAHDGQITKTQPIQNGSIVHTLFRLYCK